MIEIAYVEWVELGFRWLHLIAGIAWIGSSFYFMFLDYSLRPEKNLPAGVKGAAWNVHGGGFYFMQKYTVAPAEMPEVLHWFKWEAYFTWISGFALLIIIYYWDADAFLIDIEVMNLGRWEAIGISISSFIVSWVVYDQVCKSTLGKNDILLAAIVFILILAAAIGFTQVFSGRGAFVHVGAMIGSVMVGNVFFVIIPNQRIVVAALLAGKEPEPRLGEEGKQRSTHNNYLTLPVLLMMISSHFPMIFSNEHSWVVVGLVLIVGGIIRDFFNAKNQGKKRARLIWQWPSAGLFMALLILFVSYNENTEISEEKQLDSTGAVALVQTHCSSCHAAVPSNSDFKNAPGGVKLETLEDIKKYASKIMKQAVLTKAMPLGNNHTMTKFERQSLGDWIRRGMPNDD